METVPWATLAEKARSMSIETSAAHTMSKAVEIAKDFVVGCELAGITAVHDRHRVETVAATDTLVREADAVQYELGQGPCLSSIADHEVTLCNDLSKKSEWPQWAERVRTELGLHAALGVRLFVTDDSLGCLNMYATRPDAFDDESIARAQALGAHIAVAMTASIRIDQLQTALQNRTVIGQAEGMLMDRFSLTGPQAFQVLRRISQDRNVKLKTIAQRLVDEGFGSDVLGLP